jgi:hypothetical protein
LYCHCNRVERAINHVCFHSTCLRWEWRLRCEGECWKNICSLLLSWSLKSKASNVLLGMNFDAMCFMQSRLIKKCGSRYATGNEAWDHLCFMQWTEIENCVEGMWPLTWCWYHFIFLVLHWLIKWPLAKDNMWLRLVMSQVYQVEIWGRSPLECEQATGRSSLFNLSIMVPGLLQRHWYWMKREGERMYWRGYPKKITVHLSGWLSIICNHI